MPIGLPSDLGVVNHYVFAGRRDWRAPFRALVAGGGTGDAVLSLGWQLRALGTPAEIVYMDISGPSLAIAKQRAEEAGLLDRPDHGVSFRQAPLEDAAAAGPFDYIDLCGVLNHVTDVARALGALRSALSIGGGIGVMAYGELGRTGVYPVQQMVRMLASDEDEQGRLGVAKRLLSALPQSNWLRRNPRFGHLGTAHDVEVADVLVNPLDRAFGVGDLVGACGAVGLSVVAFMPPFLYDPTAAIRDPDLAARLDGLDQVGRWTFAELLQGSIAKHVFYAVAAPPAGSADGLLDAEATIVVPRHALRKMREDFPESPDGRVTLTMEVDGSVRHLTFAFPSLGARIVRALDGRRTIGEVARAVAAESDASEREVVDQLRATYRGLSHCGLAHLSTSPMAIG